MILIDIFDNEDMLLYFHFNFVSGGIQWMTIKWILSTYTYPNF